MRELLARDWRLYRFTLILPFSFCVLWAFLPYMFLANETITPTTPLFLRALLEAVPFTALAATAAMAGLRVQGLHLLEISNGTLQDLVALPVSRTRLVQLRLLEGGLLTVLLLLAILLEGALILRIGGSANHILPAHPLWALLALGWILFVFLLLPLPFNLRWGQRGLLWLGLGLLTALVSSTLLPRGMVVRAMNRLPGSLSTQAALLLALGGLAYLTSLWALQRREL